MGSALLTPIVAGVFALVGGLGGALLTARLARKNEDHKLSAADARRWQEDRRKIYAQYLSLAERHLKDIDQIAIFLPYRAGIGLTDEDEGLIQLGFDEYVTQWDEELQPALHEVQLMASPEVADLADRVSGALMHLTEEIEIRGFFVNHFPWWFKTQELIAILRNAMRVELGLDGALPSRPKSDPANYPWLPGMSEDVLKQYPHLQDTFAGDAIVGTKGNPSGPTLKHRKDGVGYVLEPKRIYRIITKAGDVLQRADFYRSSSEDGARVHEFGDAGKELIIPDRDIRSLVDRGEA